MSTKPKGALITTLAFLYYDEPDVTQQAADLRVKYPGALVRIFHRTVKADRVAVRVSIITVRERPKV